MPLVKAQLAQALTTAFQAGTDDPTWTTAKAAAAMADAIDSYVRGADVTGVAVDVVDTGGNPIGTGAQAGTGALA